jgi:pyruvate,water dikinase
MAESRFPSPFDIETPPGAEGWEELYTYSSLFSEGRRQWEDSRFWFWDSMHWGWPMSPWDASHMEYAIAALGQYNTRHYLVPPANGIDYRILLGVPYFSPVTIEDGATIEARVPQFMERAGHYFMNWDELYESWLGKVKANIAELEAIDFSPLPEVEPVEVVTEGRGYGSGWRLQEQYHRFKDLSFKVWEYHFEFLNLGYAAYLDFFGFCKQAFPDIPDLAIAKMVAGIEVDLFRPNEELKILARKAMEPGVAEAFDGDDPAAVASGVGCRREPVVQLQLRHGLLPLRQDLDPGPEDSLRVHPGLHQPAAGRRGHRPPHGRDRRRTRSNRDRVPGVPSDRRGP